MPVDEPPALHLPGARTYRSQVGPGLWLTHPEREEAPPGRNLRKEALLLGFSAEEQDRRPGLAICSPVRADGRSGGQEFLDDDEPFDRRAFGTPVLLRERDPQPSAGPKLLAEGLVTRPHHPERRVVGARRQLFRKKGPYLVAKLPFVRLQVSGTEVHGKVLGRASTRLNEQGWRPHGR